MDIEAIREEDRKAVERFFDHANPDLPAVWIAGIGPCICEHCRAKRTKEHGND